MSNLTKELVERGNIYRHYKGEKVGITKVEDNIVYYTDLETGEQHKKVMMNLSEKLFPEQNVLYFRTRFYVMIKSYFLYLLRWQLSTPILAVCLIWLHSLGELWATIIVNLIGGLIFFWVDRKILK